MMDRRRPGSGPFGSGPALFALAVALSACSAKTGSGFNPSDVGGTGSTGGGAAPGAGNSPNGGNTPSGGFISQGASSTGIITLGMGGTAGASGTTGAGGGLPVTSDGHLGPPMTDNCGPTLPSSRAHPAP